MSGHRPEMTYNENGEINVCELDHIGVDQGNAILVSIPNLNTRPGGVWKSTCENGPQIRQRRTIPQSTSCLILVDLWTTKPGQLIKMSRFLESPCHKPPIMNNPFHLGFKAVFTQKKVHQKLRGGKSACNSLSSWNNVLELISSPYFEFDALRWKYNWAGVCNCENQNTAEPSGCRLYLCELR